MKPQTLLPGLITFLLLSIISACSNSQFIPENESTSLHLPVPPIAFISTYHKGVVLNRSQGFVVEKEGFLLTSYQTLLGEDGINLASEIKVNLSDAEKKSYPAVIVGVEPTINIAILKISPNEPLRAANIASRDNMVPGVQLRVLSDFKDANQYRYGNLTQLNSMDCYQESMSATMLRGAIDLPDSALGGPVFNNQGEVIAMHTGYRGDDEHDDTQKGVSQVEQHILPIFLAFNIYESLKHKRSFRSPWTGFSVRRLTMAERALFPVKRFLGGIGIDYVWPGSPAEKLGIKVGDLLVRLSYYPIKSEADFQKWLYMYGVGETIKLHFVRGQSDIRVVEYTIEERPPWAVPR